MHQGVGQVGQLPHQILADQKAPPGSGGAPHYYLPPRIFDPWGIPAFKGWLSLETMKLWLLVLTKTLFLMTLIIKLTLGNIFIKVKNPPGGATVTK